MGSLQRDPNEVREFIENIDPNSNGTISFEEFINLMQSIENKIVQNGQTENNNLNSNE
jgi:Ca2+-binding EF-hand superfamily protein